MSKRFTITRPGDGTNVPVGNKNNNQPGAGAFKITRHVKAENPTYVEKTVRCPIPVGILFQKVTPSQPNSKYKMVSPRTGGRMEFVNFANIETEKGFAGIYPLGTYNCEAVSAPLVIPYIGSYLVNETDETLTEYSHPTWIDAFSNAAANSDCEITFTPYTGTLQLPDSGPGTIYESGGNITTMNATALPGISPFTLKGTIKKLSSTNYGYDATCKGKAPVIGCVYDELGTIEVPYIPINTFDPEKYDDEGGYCPWPYSIFELAKEGTIAFTDDDNTTAVNEFLDELDEGGYFGTDITLPGPKVGYSKCNEASDVAYCSFALFAVDITFTEVDPGVVQENEERRSWKLIHKDDKGIGHNIGTSIQTIENGGFETDPNVAEKVFPAEYDEFGNLIRPAQAEYCAENGVQKVVKNRPKIDRTIATEFASEN